MEFIPSIEQAQYYSRIKYHKINIINHVISAETKDNSLTVLLTGQLFEDVPCETGVARLHIAVVSPFCCTKYNLFSRPAVVVKTVMITYEKCHSVKLLTRMQW